jgi:hypothetical protein
VASYVQASASSVSTSNVLIDSGGKLEAARGKLLRREDLKVKRMDKLARRHIPEDLNEMEQEHTMLQVERHHQSKAIRRNESESGEHAAHDAEVMDELWHYTGQEKCGEHGNASHNLSYYLLKGFPLTHRQCADQCEEKVECLGFDSTIHRCRLYTIMAVGFASWGPVQFNAATGGPYHTGIFADSTAMLGELAPLSPEQAENRPHGCYIRREHLTKKSYYTELGLGVCASTNQTTAQPLALKHYQIDDIDPDLCRDECSKEDLCIAYSVDDAEMECKLYTQKEVFSWHGVTATLQDVPGAVFAGKPWLVEGDGVSLGASGGNLSCWGKTKYTEVEDLYAHDGHGPCQDWKHVLQNVAHKETCSDACDASSACVGFDFDGSNCRLFVAEEPTSGATVPGVGIFDKYASDPSVLAGSTSTSGAAVEGQGCFRKSHFRTWDLFELIGNRECNGGGWWNFYEYAVPHDFHVSMCSSKCMERPECLGFDFGNSQCKLYTTQAVPGGSWPGVAFKNGGPFVGEVLNLAHTENVGLFLPEGYAKKVQDLNVTGEPAANEPHHHHCYARLNPVAVDSFYEYAGEGTCSRRGLPSAYTLQHGDLANLTGLDITQVCNLCQEVCSEKEECVGYDCGFWLNSEITQQVYLSQFQTTHLTSPSCHMYPVKPVWGWNHVDAELLGKPRKPAQGTGEFAGLFVKNPYDLENQTGIMTQFEEGHRTGKPADRTHCVRKTRWLDREEYYMKLDHPCSPYRYYRSNIACTDHATCKEKATADCKEMCDMWETCIGFDINHIRGCHFFVTHPVSANWTHVEKNGSHAFLGDPHVTGHDAEAFALHPIDLVTYEHPPTGMGECWLKTHAPTLKQKLADAETL